jgi:hypothetical protein
MELHSLGNTYVETSTANIWHAVAYLVEALRYKPEGRWFDSRFSINLMLPATLWALGSEYQEFSWGQRATARKADNLTAICDPTV